MSKIDELIRELCPNGVEHKNLGSLGRRNKGTPITASRMKELHRDGAPIKIFAGGKTVADFPADALPEKNIINEPSIIVKSRGHIGFEYYDKPFSHKNELWSYTINDHGVDQKFVYYFLLTKVKSLQELARATSVKLPQLSVKDTDSLKIPVPPLEVQKEIVNILDKFTRLEAELSAELSAELDARRKQYEYYRNNLLGYDNSETPRLSLGDTAMYSKTRIASDELDHENYVGVDNLLQNRQGKEDSSHVPGVGNMTRYESGDVLIGNIRPYLKKIWHADRVGGTNGDVLVIHIKDEYKDKLKSRYLYHLLASDKFFTYNMKNSKGAKMPRGNKDSIMKFDIPVPTIEEQERVVSILDKFDKLVNGISEGIPAEQKARHQQYEHYRTKLLAFQEMPA